MPARRALAATGSAVALAFALSACGSGSGGGVAPPAIGTTGPTSSTPLRAVKLTASQVSALGHDDDLFAGDLVRAMAKGDPGNLVVSPASIAIALQMLTDGAAGSTRSQLDHALHIDGLSSRQLTAAAAALFGELASLGKDLSVSDDVWVQHGRPVSPEFAADMRQGFAAGLHAVDFDDPSAAAGTINAAIAADTHGHITDLLTPQQLDGALAVLTDAVYLHANWAQPFEQAQTRPMPFTTSSGSTTPVPTMNRTATWDYADRDGVQSVTLPYQDGRLAMTVLLPATGSSPAALEARAAQQGWDSLTAGEAPTSVALALPRFQMRTTTDLTSVLRSLGITDAFGPGADLSGICSQCSVSAVEHQAWIKTDEKGTTAAAATGVVVGSLAIRAGDTAVPMVVDRPFLVVIRDTRTGLPLFVAQVADPSQTP